MRAAVLHAPKDLRIEQVATPAARAARRRGAHRGRRHLRLRPALLLRRRLRHGAAEGADDPRPRDRRNGRARRRGGREREGRAARRREPEPPVRRIAATARRASSSTASTCGSTAARCAFPHVQGGFREVLVCDETQAVAVPPAMSAAQAAFAEPFAVCLHAVNRAGPLLGKRVLVTGAGPIGALTVIAARRAGALEIVATDVADAPLKVAQASARTRRSMSARRMRSRATRPTRATST